MIFLVSVVRVWVVRFDMEIDPIHLALALFGAVVLGVAIGLFLLAPKKRLNNKIDLASEKVVNKCPIPDIEDFGKKNGKEMVAFCRCWKSENLFLL